MGSLFLRAGGSCPQSPLGNIQMFPFSPILLLLLGTCGAFNHREKVGDGVDSWARLPSLPFPPWRRSLFGDRPHSVFLSSSGWNIPEAKKTVTPPGLPFPWNRRNFAHHHSTFPRFSESPHTPQSPDHIFKDLFSPLPFPPFPTVRPFFASKNNQLSTFFEDLLKTPIQHQDWSTPQQDQDSPIVDQDEDWFSTTETDKKLDLPSKDTNDKHTQDYFNHEFTIHLHGDPLKKVVKHVGYFHADLADHVGDTVSPLLNMFNNFLDTAIDLVSNEASHPEKQDTESNAESQDSNVEESANDTNSSLEADLKGVMEKDDIEILDPNVVKSFGIPNEDEEESYEDIALDPAVVEHTGLPQDDIEILDPNVVKHIGVPNSIKNEITNENDDNDLSIVDIDEVDPEENSETLASGVAEHTGIQDLKESSETLASGVAEHTGIQDLMQLLDNVDSEEDSKNDTQKYNQSTKQSQPEVNESSNSTEGTIDLEFEPIIHLIP